MNNQELAADAMAVVVIGKFDPLLVTPRWLRQKDLIGPEDYESFETELISPKASVVQFGSIQLKVVPDALEVNTEAAHDAEAARDLAAGILLSEASPSVSALGINRTVHFPVAVERWHAIGDALTPKNVWEDVLHLPGMMNAGLMGARNDGYSGSVNVSVQPSAAVRPGVFVSVNDHYTLTKVEPPTQRFDPSPPETNVQSSPEKVAIAARILSEGFSASRGRAQAIINRVGSLGDALGGNQ
ncbi:hypothetical protein [Streptomyces sp. NPDC102487]|uniref:hypothetical protein n=1 Tax=Streptomyces sp. NPDC102487 TaxID=3366182 RepID=UPI0037FCD09B